MWRYGGLTMNQWNYGSFGFYINSPYKILIEGARGGSTGYIALDDILFKDSTYCTVTPSYAQAGTGLPLPQPSTTIRPPVTSLPTVYDCDFEVDFCNWKQDPNNDIDWERNRASTTTLETGPSVDHTLGTSQGWYIFIETSYPAKPDDKARLESILVSEVPPNKCLSFYYHMFGKDVNTLNAIIKRSFNDEDIVWTKSGDQGNIWKHGLVNIESDRFYSIIFEAIRGNNFLGDIALDDISLTDGFCPVRPQFGCDFDEDWSICGFTNDSSANFNWTRASGRPNAQTGPGVDHTVSKMFYLKRHIF
jgi:hypothetical protein